jgi:porin
VTKWSYIQPDLQYVIDPGGTGDIPNAIVIGAQMGVTL